ncbi:energy transducer TonB [Bacteroides caecimuris]|uniref:energy transducer TonB n=1 Tax=Bacteroides caecimuris TaxID=1796613 RepID=UPI0025B73E7E|nr:energy transducer TonB [Bacteroides caecimuris]
MKHKLNTIIRAIMVACFSSASISSFASCEEAISANARELKQDLCNVERCHNVNVCDSINMPVFIVDGVEVELQDLSNLPAEDVEKMKVVKDENIKKIFSPRLGGIVLITTKSKRFLKPILENYNRMMEEKEQNRIPGQIIIRGDSIRSDSTYNWPIYEVKPSFPGGESALYEFLESNMQYPEEAKRNNEHGRVIVTFYIEKDGTVTNPRILRGCTPSLDAEALRLVSIMPKWTPGKMNGELKRVSFSLPIIFK